jgi:xanthosine utilization system XapX-like protein
MYAFGLFAGMVVVGFVFAKLRGRSSNKPSVTHLISPKH